MRRALTVADSLPSEWLVTSTHWPFILYLSLPPFLSNSGNFLLPLQNCTSARGGSCTSPPIHIAPVANSPLRWKGSVGWEEVETTLFSPFNSRQVMSEFTT